MRCLRTLCRGCLLCVVAALVSCQGGNNRVNTSSGGDTLRFKYATLLTVVRYADHTHVVIRNPWARGKVLRQYDISKPLGRAVVTTTAHCQLLTWLGAGAGIAGVCDAQYIQVPYVWQGLRQRRITDCGNSMSPSIEKMVAAGADAIIVSPFENSGGYGKLEQLGIPIIEAADYMEPSPLARAEWMRLYGLLFGCERQADSLFHVVDSTYNHLKAKARQLPVGRRVLCERKTGSVWYCPGGRSTIGQLIADAHGRYVWQEDRHSGSLTLAPEQVIDRAATADLWLFVYMGAPITRSQLLDEYEGYRTLRAMSQGHVYGCNSGRCHFFEETPFRPDYLLRDYVQLIHPGVQLGGLRYYKQVE